MHYDIFDLIQMNLNSQKTKSLPYNIYQNEDNDYILEMAVAGFHKDNIEVTLNKNTLTISGKTPEDSKDRVYHYRGIARRNFTSHFTLGKNTLVNGAEVEDGLLKVYMEEKVPDEEKPLQIEVK